MNIIVLCRCRTCVVDSIMLVMILSRNCMHPVLHSWETQVYTHTNNDCNNLLCSIVCTVVRCWPVGTSDGRVRLINTPSRVDAAFRSESGDVYLFSGDEYYRYGARSNKVRSGYVVEHFRSSNFTKISCIFIFLFRILSHFTWGRCI